jgi:aminopeptidase-like protein
VCWLILVKLKSRSKKRLLRPHLIPWHSDLSCAALDIIKLKTDLNLTEELEAYFDRLWPLTRSLTGQGNRETLRILSEIIPLQLHELPSGTTCFDWTIPPEWRPKEAWIKDSKGNVIVDYKNNNLHLLGYSKSFKGKVSFQELKEHVYSLPEKPDRIPYVVSYYQERWGFCVAHNELENWDKHDTYDVFIDAEHDPNGSLTYGDLVLKGKSEEEILFSTYICHPSMANDQISGMLVTAFLYRELSKISNRKYTYRFVFGPETIGAIAYLHQYGDHLKANTKAGYVVCCVGDKGDFTYKHTKHQNTLTNRCTLQVLKESGKPFNEVPFIPQGSDERQYASPGFDLPVGSLMRSMYWNFEEYHTSADNKEFISFTHLEESLKRYLDIVALLENNRSYENLFPFGEVQLGKRGLYPTLGRGNDKSDEVTAYQWILNCSDRKHDLIAIAERSGLPTSLLAKAAATLQKEGLIKEVTLS